VGAWRFFYPGSFLLCFRCSLVFKLGRSFEGGPFFLDGFLFLGFGGKVLLENCSLNKAGKQACFSFLFPLLG